MTEGGCALGYLTLMVREHKVHTASVNVKLLSKILSTHSRALKVPAWETITPR